MRRLAFVLLALVPLAGCVEDGPGNAPAAPETAAPAQEEAPALPVLAPESSSTNASRQMLANLTEFHWAFPELVENLTLEMAFNLNQENDCEVSRAFATRHIALGPNRLALAEIDGRLLGWHVGSSGSGLVSAHAGGTDTREFASGSMSAGLDVSRGVFSGELKLTFAALMWEGWDSSFLPENVSAGVSITCAKPFDVVGARASRAMLLADTSNLQGGIGATTFVAGSANIDDRLSANLPSRMVRATCAGFGLHAAQATLSYPEGEETWTLGPSFSVVSIPGEEKIVEGTAGSYTFSVNQAGAYFEALWCAAWGLDIPVDLTQGLVPETVITSPF